MRRISRGKFVVIVSFFLCLLAIEGWIYNNTDGQSLNIKYESFDVRNISTANVTKKFRGVGNGLSNIIKVEKTSYSFKAVVQEEEAKEEKKEEVVPVAPPVPFWHLPTEMGTISQNPHYSHMAFDITSPRGSNEVIYPVANGVITSIYNDAYGALIVTILHEADGARYTSQYVHLSRYAEGLYVGKWVSYTDPIGWMGTSGYSTGVHLHIAVLDCALYDPNDANCPNLNSFFTYGNKKALEGYWGLGSYVNVPVSWTSRS